MKKEDINLIAQLLSGIKEALEKLEYAQRRKDMEEMTAAKQEILNFQAQIDELI